MFYGGFVYSKLLFVFVLFLSSWAYQHHLSDRLLDAKSTCLLGLNNYLIDCKFINTLKVLQVNLLPRRSLEEVICSSSLPPLIEIWVMAHERETCCITPEQKVPSPVFSWATHLLIFLYPQWCCDQHRPGCTCVWKLRSFRTRRYFTQTITAIGSLYLYPHFLSRTPTGKEAH